MALPTTFEFGELIIEIGDGATPEVFTAPCGLTSKSFNAQANTNDTIVPDCDDPDAPAWLERSVASLSRDITGSGVMAAESGEIWDDWFSSGNAKNVRVNLNGGAGRNWQWAGSYVLTQFEITGSFGDKLQVNVTMQSDGEVTREDS